MTDLHRRTATLLHNLGNLRVHIEKSVWNTQQLEELEIKALFTDRDPDMIIYAIRNSVTRTEILLADAERIFYDWWNSGRTRKDKELRRVVWLRYFEKHTIEAIGKHFKKSEGYVRAILGTALTQLSACFFGELGKGDDLSVSAKEVKAHIACHTSED
ncbi:hypothetical protein FACS1894202_13400 [Clostridia bacterium]|nr:hypothetical protein FACS1894202_13400 [Clostridia bacterium]